MNPSRIRFRFHNSWADLVLCCAFFVFFAARAAIFPYKANSYYSGDEKSGMLVQDPSTGNDVDSIFAQARQQGAVQGPLENLQPSSSRSFARTGKLLSGETVPIAAPQPESVVHNIVFWRNGFTVGDGPLRRLDDPENTEFLESIRKSECPKELEPANRRSSVSLAIGLLGDPVTLS